MRRPDSDVDDRDLDPANQDPDWDLDPEPEVSEPTSNLAAALSKAQSQIKGATRDSVNPHFKSKYADLASVWDACRKPLSDNGLSIIQFTQVCHDGVIGHVLITRLLHVSGESVEGVTPLLLGKVDMQALGSAITYARRYGLAAMVGVSPEDDDGNAAVEGTPERKPVTMAKPDGYDQWLQSFEEASALGLDTMGRAYGAGLPEFRKYLAATNPGLKDTLKAQAHAADAEVAPF